MELLKTKELTMDGKERSARSHALRKGRYSIPGQIYLITTVTKDRISVFNDLYCGRLLVKSLKIYETSAQTLCYVIMPDHLHWLISLGSRQSLSQVVSGIKALSARQINQHLQRQGPMWQDGFHDRAIRAEEDIRSVARYVVANPLRAELVNKIENYPLWDTVWL